mgnify:FL=1
MALASDGKGPPCGSAPLGAPYDDGARVEKTIVECDQVQDTESISMIQKYSRFRERVIMTVIKKYV